MTGTAPAPAKEAPRPTRRPRPPGGMWRTLLSPVAIVAAGAGWLAYVENTNLDGIERRSLDLGYVGDKIVQHIELTVVATVLVLVIALPLGVLLSRSWARIATPVVLAIANVGQSAPAIGVVVLLAVVFGIGFWTAIVALVVYGVLPALRNTMVGLQQVDSQLVDAGRGIGMSATAVLLRIELPLAVPVILAGVRTTLVLMVGVASIAAFISGGGLGNLVTIGVSTQRTPILLTGSILIALLALLIDWLGGVVNRYLAPRGL